MHGRQGGLARGVEGLKRGVEVIVDHQGLAVRLTDERQAHILDHPEMVRLGLRFQKP
jgi:hypothetical protein